MPHVVLLGDSIFDNAAYVGGAPDVVRQLRAKLPEGFRATLLAVDGAVTAGVQSQLRRLPADASHLVVSVGGNDALRHSGILAESARSVAEAVHRIAGATDEFATDYRAMLDAVLAQNLPTAVCTIYDPRFDDPLQRKLAATALATFNDRITREGFSRGLPLIDLRLICNEDRDFANPIEPSARGGDKIAAAIAGLVTGHGFGAGPPVVIAR
ncbi:MAG TPA: SGNH/GDSL hydrolase family protein [Mesorhizobium sp.]|nr:SGNH/GDSL hydrolase family protein [Mesorhizobium sp.]